MAKRSATVDLRSFKVSWVMSPERVPRDVLPPEGEPGEVEWLLQLEESAPPIYANFNARNYRHVVKELDANPGGLMLTLQGQLTGRGGKLVLEKAGFRVERRMSRGPGAAGPGGPPRGPRPERPAVRGPEIQVVRRLK
jgi:hypothetical protein